MASWSQAVGDRPEQIQCLDRKGPQVVERKVLVHLLEGRVRGQWT